MKRLAFILFLFAAFIPSNATASDLVVSNNSSWVWFGDSFSADDDSANAGNITGYRGEAYIHSYLVLKYPQYNIRFANFSRSGGTMNDYIIAVAKVGVPFWGYQTNNNQHVGITYATENGGLDSNAMYAVTAIMFQAPLLMTNGVASTNEPGWASTNTVQWIDMGAVPQENSTGDGGTVIARNGAGTNAGWTVGNRSVDLWALLSQSWTDDYNANGGTNVGWFAAPKGGHVGGGGHLSWALAFISSIDSDTNISTCILDWNGSIVDTNHCVVMSNSVSGNTLTFVRHDDRLPMAWDYPDGTITNDSSGGLRLLPSYIDKQRFIIQVTNLPAGLYNVIIDGVTCGTGLTNTILAAGWNMFTNTVGPYWNQRTEVLGRIRDLEAVNRITLIPRSAGDQLGLVTFGSNADAEWQAGYRGDALIAQMDSKAAQIQTNYTAIHAAAQPTNHTFRIVQAGTNSPPPIRIRFHR